MLLYINRILSVIVIFFYIQCGCSWGLAGFEIKIPKFNSYNPYCYVKECCNEDWIRFNKGRLLRNLTDRVYGQPLLEEAINALSSHFNPYFPPSKPLTLSFHGMTGTGKNYVSKFITESLFVEGTKSKYVHHFIGRMHFSEESKTDEYKQNLYSWLKGNVSACPKQLFIFDEVDKMVPELLNVIKPLIDYRDEVEGVSYSQSVFIFLSNTGSDIINEHFHDLYMEGKSREDLTIADFETFIQKGAFNEKGWFNRGEGYFVKMARSIFYRSFIGSVYQFSCFVGGFHHCDAIKSNLIDHYIPFLPLEQTHIVMCITDEFKLRRVLDPKKEHIEQIMKFIEWGPDSSKKFSKTGCKRIGPKVAAFVDKYYGHYSFGDKDEL